MTISGEAWEQGWKTWASKEKLASSTSSNPQELAALDQFLDAHMARHGRPFSEPAVKGLSVQALTRQIERGSRHDAEALRHAEGVEERGGIDG